MATITGNAVHIDLSVYERHTGGEPRRDVPLLWHFRIIDKAKGISLSHARHAKYDDALSSAIEGARMVGADTVMVCCR